MDMFDPFCGVLTVCDDDDIVKDLPAKEDEDAVDTHASVDGTDNIAMVLAKRAVATTKIRLEERRRNIDTRVLLCDKVARERVIV